jgi:hypothetical protein
MLRGFSSVVRSPAAAALGAVSMGTILFLFAAVACSTSSSPDNMQSPDTGPATNMTSLGGVVTDSTGKVLSGVTVTAGGASTTTKPNGTFSMAVSPTAGLVVGFAQPGYLSSSKIVTTTQGTSTLVAAALAPAATPVPLDATKGGMATGARGASLKADPGVLVDGSGKAVSGMVDVSLTPLSPANPGELAAYPGSLVGSMAGGTPTLLQTYGVLDVTVSQNGQPVQVASGKTVTVNIPVAMSANLPTTQDLWSFNLTTGIWDHEGTAQLSGTTYTAELGHFSYHNIDAALHDGQATCVTGIVVDGSGNPVAGADVSPAEGASTDSLITTDSNGAYCTWILTGGSEAITANSTASPYGTGSVTVTSSETSIPFPGSYTCSNLACVQAPKIVLNQPPCTASSDCQTGYQCCTVSGKGMCLQDFACLQAQSGSTAGGGGKPGACTMAGPLTATYLGQTVSWNCFTADLLLTATSGMGGELIISASSTSPSGITFELQISAPNGFGGFASGTTIPFVADGGLSDGGQTMAGVIIAGTLPGGGTLELFSGSGSMQFTSWSTSGGPLGISFTGVGLVGDVLEDGGSSSMTVMNGTLSGTVTVTPVVVP